MKRTLIILIGLVSLSSMGQAQATNQNEVGGKVERVSGIPIFIYAIPLQAYEVVGKAGTFIETMKLAVNDDNFQKKAEKLVQTSLKRKSDGKIPDFDAILIDSKKAEEVVIKFKDTVSLEASVLSVKGIYVFLFSAPNRQYSVIATFPAKFSRRANNGLLHDKVKYIIKQSQNKVTKGELKSFDAIIINPADFSFQCIEIDEAQ